MFVDIVIYIALLAALTVAQEYLRPKPRFEQARPAGLGDFRFPTASQQRMVPLIWGTVRQKGPNVVWYGDLRQEPISKYMRTGLWSGERVTTGFRYFIGIQFVLCRGPGVILTKILISDRAVWEGEIDGNGTATIDEQDLFGGAKLGRGGVVGVFVFYRGSGDQPVDPYLAEHQNVAGDTPRYFGTSYGVFRFAFAGGQPNGGGYIGTQTSIDPWEFELRRIPNGLALANPTVNSGFDANPMNVLYELYTDTRWGFGYPAADIDVANWQAAAATLRTEGNGISLLIDTEIEGRQLETEILRQIGGVTFVNPRTGKWQVKLARNDYNIDTVPQIGVDELSEARDYLRRAWEDTQNVVDVTFENRDRDYADDVARAQDLANVATQDGRVVIASLRFPGVKNAALANALAWREIRVLSHPLAQAVLVVDRSFWDTNIGDVVAWTDPDRGFVKLPMRVVKVEYGDDKDAKINLHVMQDVFQHATGLFGNPPASLAGDKKPDVVAYPTDEQMAFEAPRALVYRDPVTPGLIQGKVFAAARSQRREASFFIRVRHAAGTPSGSYTEFGEVFGFARIGSLKTGIAAGVANPTSSIVIEADPDTKEDLEELFLDGLPTADLGTNLLNLILIDGEFMLVRTAAISGSDVDLQNVYRGVLDSGQAKHAAGAAVWLLFTGSGLTDTPVPLTDNVEVKLVPTSTKGTLSEASATAIAFTMARRVQRPYPPGRASLNGSIFASSASLDSVAAGAAETTGIALTYLRRDYRTADGEDEIAALAVDAPTLFPDFPIVNSTTHEVAVRNDPDGANTLLFTETAIAGASATVLRLKVLRFTDGAVPSRMRLEISARHDADGQTGLLSRQPLTVDFNTTSAALAGKFNFGARAANTASAVYTATVNGTYAFTLSTSFSSGAVEYRLNGGSWLTLIAAGNTSGNIAGVVATDTIEVRHTSAVSGALKQLDMDAPGAGQDAYAVLYV